MRRIFVDSSAYIAMLNARDGLHAPAVAVMRELARTPEVNFVTTDGVLMEVLTRLGPFGATSRLAAVRFARSLDDDPQAELVPVDRTLFVAGLDLYSRRLDKAYSMVDCMSMVVCRERDIREVFTSDHDFEQEGFRILL